LKDFEDIIDVYEVIVEGRRGFVYALSWICLGVSPCATTAGCWNGVSSGAFVNA
jgi:hypothetical protein